MPEYLTLDGYPIPVREGGGLLQSWEQSGERVRMFDNSLASSENPLQRKRVWAFSTPPMTHAELRPIVAIMEAPAVRAAAGYAITRALGALSANVTVRTAAVAGALTVNVNALTYPMPVGTVLTFTGGKVVTTTTAAQVGALSIATTAVPAGGLAIGNVAPFVLDAAEPASVTVLPELGEVPNLPLGDADVSESLSFKLHET